MQLGVGMDWVRDMGGARLAERDLTWLLDKGEEARGRYGNGGRVHDGELGEQGTGSVERRIAAVFRRCWNSGG